MTARRLEIRGTLDRDYHDISYAGGPCRTGRIGLPGCRSQGPHGRPDQRGGLCGHGIRSESIFLDPNTTIGRTQIKVQDARDGNFTGGEIPPDLRRQWIQGTGPAAKPHAPIESSIRNTAYAMLSGADGWMFDGEDALGQVESMSLDNQRNLKLAIGRDPIFMKAAEKVAGEMNQWATLISLAVARSFTDWVKQLDFTTKIFRARGLHLDDRHVRHADGTGFSASIVDAPCFIW